MIKSNKIIIACGSRPVFTDSIKPDSERIFSFQNLKELNDLPNSAIVIGEGVIGYEIVNLFLHLGVEVSCLFPQKPFGLFDKEIIDYLHEDFLNKGAKIVRGGLIREVKNEGKEVVAIREDGSKFVADVAFVTLGFRSNMDQLNIENTDLKLNQYGTVDCNEFGQTEIKHIYLVGDSRMPISFTAVHAMAQARAATLHALNVEARPVNLINLPNSFNEKPQIASVGYTNTEDNNVHYKKIPYHMRNFRAFMTNSREGFLKIVWNKDGKIIGGICIGEQAKDIISMVSLMIHLECTVDQVNSFFGSHPAASELAFINLNL